MSEQEFIVEKLTFGGSGLGRLEGKVCFVPFSAPGDRAEIRVTSEKRSYLEGELIQLLTPSPLRVSPPCPIFGICGGCNWQHLSYSVQTEAKQEIFTELLWRSGRVERELILPMATAPEPYGYRSRMQFKLRCTDGTVHIGFYRAGSHWVEGIPGQCAIAKPVINRLLAELQSILSGFPEADRIPQIDVTVGDDDTACLIFHYIGSRHRELSGYLEKQPTLAAAGLYIQSGRKSSLQKISGPELLSYNVSHGLLPGIPATRLTFSPGAFSQVNYQQNLALIATVYEWAGLSGGEKVLDLYCGNGNLSIPLAGNAARIVGFEGYAPSITDAQRNCRVNDVHNAIYKCSDAASSLLKIADKGETFDVVILDPPRTGAAELVRHIPRVKPAKILYVSCDPATLARDIDILKKLSYRVVKCLPVDMFPQTYHIESVTLLEPA